MTDGIARPELPRRFYKVVSIEETGTGFAVLLDGRTIRTPARRPLVAPGRISASLVAEEWEAQAERIDPATMPMTRLLNSAVDGVADDPAPVLDDAAGYVETDLLFYRASDPERLVARQSEGWDPVVHWAEAMSGGRFTLAEGVMHVAQPRESIAGFRARLATIGHPHAVAGFHQMTTLTGSALLALAVAEGRLSIEEAWDLAHLDEDWNIELWGEDEEARARRSRRFAEMQVAAVLLADAMASDTPG